MYISSKFYQSYLCLSRVFEVESTNMVCMKHNRYFSKRKSSLGMRDILFQLHSRTKSLGIVTPFKSVERSYVTRHDKSNREPTLLIFAPCSCQRSSCHSCSPPTVSVLPHGVSKTVTLKRTTRFESLFRHKAFSLKISVVF
jgi:hypothetical protein